MKIIVVCVILSLVLTLSSLLYQRPSNEIVQFGTECTPAYWYQCYHPNISGGFLFAYVFDSPDTSVLNSLGLEDDLRWYPFAINLWFYFIGLLFSCIAFRFIKKAA